MFIRRVYLVLAAALLGFSWWQGGAAAQVTKPTSDLRVVVTSKPIHSLVSEVMTGVGVPSLLVEGAASPHTYAMRPSDAQKVNRAHVFFRVSETLEPFTARVVKSLPRAVVVSTLGDVPQVKRLERRSGGPFEAHGHDKGGPDQGKKAHAHHDHGHGSAAAYDAHVWLDPDNAKAMLGAVAGVLAKARPEHAAQFAANAARASARIEAMSASLARDLAPVAGRPFIVLHDAYQYFEKRFGLSAIGSILIDPDERPSARRITDLRRKVAESSAVCVFAEPNHQPRIIETVVEGTRSRTAVLDPEGATLEPGPDLYTLLMERLASGMKACLSQDG